MSSWLMTGLMRPKKLSIRPLHHGAQIGIVCLWIPASLRNVRNTALLKTASLSVLMARGFPWWPMARHKCPISVQLRLFKTATSFEHHPVRFFTGEGRRQSWNCRASWLACKALAVFEIPLATHESQCGNQDDDDKKSSCGGPNLHDRKWGGG